MASAPGRFIRLVSMALASLLLSGNASAQGVPTRSATLEVTSPGPAAVVNAAAHYVDEIFSRTMSSLELIAATAEAQAADWAGVKPYLQRLAPHLPALHFMVLPDGSYYTLEEGRSDKNLRDRPYFASLFSGTPVRGFPVHGRTTGSKVAVMAVPVVVNGKVVAAVGASALLDELRTRISRDLALPPGHTWFVIDRNGNTLLDRDREFILMNVFEQGSPSMRQAVRAALQADAGRSHYTADGERDAYFRKLPDMGWWMFLAQTGPAGVDVPPRHAAALRSFADGLQVELERIDTALADLIETLPPPRPETDLRPVLARLLTAHPELIDAAFIDARGVLRQIAPARHAGIEGTDLSGTSDTQEMLAAPAPRLAAAFTSVDDGTAVSVMRPLYNAAGRFVGTVSARFRPSSLAEHVAATHAPGDDQEAWIMQTDGRILYDRDAAEIGRLLFDDPVYAAYDGLLALGRDIAAQADGTGGYVFAAAGGRTEVVKHAAWATVGLHGREWRVVLAYRAYERP